MMLSNLNLSSLPECNFEVRYVDSILLNPCAEYQRLLRMGKVARIAANFSEYIRRKSENLCPYPDKAGTAHRGRSLHGRHRGFWLQACPPWSGEQEKPRGLRPCD